jgi:phosphatidylserine/phosphatidylglycerophosphate/cardiolipin synthase-like enzyme
MQINSYFTNIRGHLLDLLDSADTSIKIAMAWFTNPTLFQLLVDKAASGVRISLVISDSEANFRSGYCLDFSRLTRKAMDVYVLPTANDVFMHNKYAIIDEQLIITGSYNWTNNAQTNLENIVVIRDQGQARNYSLQYDRLITRGAISLPDFLQTPILSLRRDIVILDEAVFALTREFETEAAGAMQEAKRLVPSLSLDIIDSMTKRYTAVGAAAKLSNDKAQSGFIKLIEINKAELTFEYMVAKVKYRKIFDKTTVNNAKKKLFPFIGQLAEEL